MYSAYKLNKYQKTRTRSISLSIPVMMILPESITCSVERSVGVTRECRCSFAELRDLVINWNYLCDDVEKAASKAGLT